MSPATVAAMDCPDCEAPTIPFRVPATLREHAPGDAVAVCSSCLCLHRVDDAPPASSFDGLLGEFPSGEAGAATALAAGLLGSLALNRAAVLACCEFAERAGADPVLALDRLDAAGSVAPHYDLGRRRSQLVDFLDA